MSTRIGESLREFNRRHARRVLRRGAVVLILSDGWERGDVNRLRREMRFLNHRCHRLIWLNPHLGRKGYEPKMEGMVAACRCTTWTAWRRWGGIWRGSEAPLTPSVPLSSFLQRWERGRPENSPPDRAR